MTKEEDSLETYKTKVKRWEGYQCPNCGELRTHKINMKIHLATECEGLKQEEREEVKITEDDWGF